MSGKRYPVKYSVKKSGGRAAPVRRNRALAVRLLAALAVATVVAVVPVLGQTPSGDADAPLTSAGSVIQAAQDNMRLASFEAVTRMIINDGRGNSRTRELAMISAWYPEERVEKRLIRFLSPADVRGTGLLTWDHDEGSDDMWLYLPALRRARRLASTEKSGNFMGSEFTYADMTALSTDDFDYQLQGTGMVEGVLCYLLVQTPRDQRLEREYGFSRREIAVTAAELVIRQARYYDSRGRATRTLTADRITEIAPGRYRPLFMEMENLQNGRTSQLITDRWQTGEGVGTEYFTVPRLEQP